MTERLIEVGADPGKIVTCPRGIDLSLFRPADDEAARTPSVIVTRAFHRAYRHDVIVRALSILSERHADLRATFVGEGEARAEVEVLSREVGLSDRVDFAGALVPERLAERLREASVYVSAVLTDGVSASLLEAMASGTYPVVTDNVANRLWVEDGKNGTLVSCRGPEGLADAVSAALDDADVRARAAVRNRAIVAERADLYRNMKTIEHAYERLVSSAGGGVA